MRDPFLSRNMKTILIFIFLVFLTTSAFGGSISGKLLKDNGKIAPWIELELVPIDEDTVVSTDPSTFCISLQNGTFSFPNVKPGKYTLSVNIEDYPSELSPYPAHFYPMTANRESAEIFDVTETSKRTNLVFKLPPPLKMVTLRGTVYGVNGKPLPNIMVLKGDIQKTLTTHAKTDSKGGFTISGFPNHAITVMAVIMDNEFAQFSFSKYESEPVKIDFSDPTKHIELKLKPSEENQEDNSVGMAFTVQ